MFVGFQRGGIYWICRLLRGVVELVDTDTQEYGVNEWLEAFIRAGSTPAPPQKFS